jgi:hypothetical protein
MTNEEIVKEVREVREMNERAERQSGRYEYRTTWASNDPEDNINALAMNGWKLHSVIVDGVRLAGETRYMIVMERETEA